MKLIGLIFLLCSSAFAGQVIKCQAEKKSDLSVVVKFETEDLSKYAKFLIKGAKLFAAKQDKQDSCPAFAMRTHYYYNSFVIHNFSCDLWSCSLFTPDTINGEPLKKFTGKLQCSPAHIDQAPFKKFNLSCTTYIE